MRSPFYENVLTKQGVKFSYLEKVDLDDIDAKKSLANQARLENPVDDELVESYGKARKEGDKFPPLVLWKPPRGRLITIDGNQRRIAFLKVGIKTHDAYVVECQDEMVIDRLTWSFNNLVNGKRLTPEEALAHAVSWARKYGRTYGEAAREWKVSEHRVKTATWVEEVRDRLNAHDIPRVASIPASTLQDMYPLVHMGEDLLVEAGKIVVESGLRTADVERLVKDVAAAKTTDAKKETIASFAASEEVQMRRAETKNGMVKVVSSPQMRFLSHLRQVNRELEDYKKALRPAGGKAFEEFRELCADVVDRLTELAGLGKGTGRAKE